MSVINKTVLEANAIPNVAIDFMNNTHVEEIELVKKVGDVIAEYEQRETFTSEEIKVLNDLLHEWLHHTEEHFARENELMQKISFPMYSVHLSEHERVLENMIEVIQSWDRNFDINRLANFIFSAWPEWFNNHVNSMDMVTAQFAVMNGFDPHTTVAVD